MIGRAGPADGLDDLAQRGAHLELGHAGPPPAAAHGADDGAGGLGRADLAEPGRPLGQDAGDVGEGLGVVDQRRGGRGLPAGRGHDGAGGRHRVTADVVDAVAEGRGDAGERLPAVDHLEERGLLAVEVLGRTLDDDEIAVRPAGVLHLGQGGTEPFELGLERRLEGEDDPLGVDRLGGDEGPFDDPVGVAAQQHPVLEGSRLTLGGVDHDRWAGSRWRRLRPRWPTCGRWGTRRRPGPEGRTPGSPRSWPPGRACGPPPAPPTAGVAVGLEAADGFGIEHARDLVAMPATYRTGRLWQTRPSDRDARLQCGVRNSSTFRFRRM